MKIKQNVSYDIKGDWDMYNKEEEENRIRELGFLPT